MPTVLVRESSCIAAAHARKQLGNWLSPDQCPRRVGVDAARQNDPARRSKIKPFDLGMSLGNSIRIIDNTPKCGEEPPHARENVYLHELQLSNQLARLDEIFRGRLRPDPW